MPLTIPNNAPFSGAQRMWLKGFLDGIHNAMAVAETPTTSEPATTTGGIPVTILWGSQTGNSEGLAKKVAKKLQSGGHQPTVVSMADASPESLATADHLLVITSTYGDGEPPDNAAALHAALHADNAPSMAKVNFSVLALGDSNYAEFCKCGNDFDKRLAALGAKRLVPLVECDVDYDAPFATWTDQVSTALALA